MPRNRLILALLVAAFATAASTAQDASFEGATSVVVIEVPVQVARGGEPVRGLQSGNFELIVSGNKQKILDFQEIDLSQIGAARGPEGIATLPVVARRHFLFFFDLSFAQPAGVIKAQTAARQLLLEGLHPTDLVGVAIYTEARGVNLLVGFTSDRRQVNLALETLGELDGERVRDPLGIMMAEYQVVMERFGGYQSAEQEAEGRRGPIRFEQDSQHLANLKDQAAMSGRASRDQIRNQILALTTSLEELANHLASVDGRKYLLFFSEGFDSASLLGTDDTARIQELNKEASFGQLWRVDSDERYGDTATQQGVFDMLDQFRRCDCTIQAIDIGGVRAGADFSPRPSGEQSLFVMADHTGGELFRNFNDLNDAMQEVLGKTSVTYLLSFQPEEMGEPGLFHPIKVKLKGGPKGARVVHRPGYYAPRPYAQLDADERRFETLELLMAGSESGALDASLLAAPFPGSTGSAEVLTMVEIEGYSLLRGHQGSVLPTEVFAYALDREGSVVDFLGQAISFDLQKVRPALDNRGFKFIGRLEMPPGDYQVRVLVRNVLTGSTATRIANVRVPAFDMAEPALLPPFFIEPEGSWLVGQERRDGGSGGYPLTIAGRQLIPAARPFLRTSTEIPVMLVAHNLGRDDLSAECKLLPVDGGDPIRLDLILERRDDTDMPGVERLAARIGPGRAEPGEYDLEISLKQSDQPPIVSSIPVRIY